MKNFAEITKRNNKSEVEQYLSQPGITAEYIQQDQTVLDTQVALLTPKQLSLLISESNNDPKIVQVYQQYIESYLVIFHKFLSIQIVAVRITTSMSYLKLINFNIVLYID